MYSMARLTADSYSTREKLLTTAACPAKGKRGAARSIRDSDGCERTVVCDKFTSR